MVSTHIFFLIVESMNTKSIISYLFSVQQLDVKVETKTLDNVFITTVVTIQYQILQEKVYEAFYGKLLLRLYVVFTDVSYCNY